MCVLLTAQYACEDVWCFDVWNGEADRQTSSEFKCVSGRLYAHGSLSAFPRHFEKWFLKRCQNDKNSQRKQFGFCLFMSTERLSVREVKKEHSSSYTKQRKDKQSIPHLHKQVDTEIYLHTLLFIYRLIITHTHLNLCS